MWKNSAWLGTSIIRREIRAGDDVNGNNVMEGDTYLRLEEMNGKECSDGAWYHEECLVPGHLYGLTSMFTIQQPYNNLCNAVIKGSLSHSTPNSLCVVTDGCTCENVRVCLKRKVLC